MVKSLICIETCAPDDTPCTGCGCDWQGTLADVTQIDDCTLDAGDASPAGRCPECGDLVYLDRPIDRIRDGAEDGAALAAMIIHGDGAQDLSDEGFEGDIRALARKILANAGLETRAKVIGAKIKTHTYAKEA